MVVFDQHSAKKPFSCIFSSFFTLSGNHFIWGDTDFFPLLRFSCSDSHRCDQHSIQKIAIRECALLFLRHLLQKLYTYKWNQHLVLSSSKSRGFTGISPTVVHWEPSTCTGSYDLTVFCFPLVFSSNVTVTLVEIWTVAAAILSRVEAGNSGSNTLSAGPSHSCVLSSWMATTFPTVQWRNFANSIAFCLAFRTPKTLTCLLKRNTKGQIECDGTSPEQISSAPARPESEAWCATLRIEAFT